MHHGTAMQPMHVEQVAAIAEGVLELGGGRERVDVQAEFQHALAAVVAGAQPQQHEAALGQFLVAVAGNVLDPVPALCHCGLSSISHCGLSSIS